MFSHMLPSLVLSLLAYTNITVPNTPDINNLIEERLIPAPSFGRLCSKSHGPIHAGRLSQPGRRSPWCNNCFTSQQTGSRERERRDRGQDILKDTSPMTCFLQLGPLPEVSEPPTSCGLSKCPPHAPQGTFHPETLADVHHEGRQLWKAREHEARHTHLISSMQ